MYNEPHYDEDQGNITCPYRHFNALTEESLSQIILALDYLNIAVSGDFPAEVRSSQAMERIEEMRNLGVDIYKQSNQLLKTA